MVPQRNFLTVANYPADSFIDESHLFHKTSLKPRITLFFYTSLPIDWIWAVLCFKNFRRFYKKKKRILEGRRSSFLRHCRHVLVKRAKLLLLVSLIPSHPSAIGLQGDLSILECASFSFHSHHPTKKT